MDLRETKIRVLKSRIEQIRECIRVAEEDQDLFGSISTYR